HSASGLSSHPERSAIPVPPSPTEVRPLRDTTCGPAVCRVSTVAVRRSGSHRSELVLREPCRLADRLGRTGETEAGRPLAAIRSVERDLHLASAQPGQDLRIAGAVGPYQPEGDAFPDVGPARVPRVAGIADIGRVDG